MDFGCFSGNRYSFPSTCCVSKTSLMLRNKQKSGIPDTNQSTLIKNCDICGLSINSIVIKCWWLFIPHFHTEATISLMNLVLYCSLTGFYFSHKPFPEVPEPHKMKANFKSLSAPTLFQF